MCFRAPAATNRPQNPGGLKYENSLCAGSAFSTSSSLFSIDGLSFFLYASTTEALLQALEVYRAEMGHLMQCDPKVSSSTPLQYVLLNPAQVNSAIRPTHVHAMRQYVT